MSEFRMPSLGADMEAGTLVEWMKQPGDRIRRGDAIAAVETQKGAIEVEAFEEGVLGTVLVPVGEKVPVGTVLAIIRTEGDASASTAPAEATTPPAAEAPVAAAVSAPAAMPVPPAVTPHSGGPSPPGAATVPAAPARMSPAARRRAQELGLDPARLVPGADGTIGLAEVESAGGSQSAAAGEATVSAGRAVAGSDNEEMRKAIAAAMARSWREIPHYFVSSTLDLEPMLSWLSAGNAARPIPERLHYAVPLIRAIALGLRATPELNGHYMDGAFVASPRVNLGVAVAMRGGGLIAPALLDADQLPLAELMRRLNDLVARVRGGRLRSSEMTAGTATLTNLGEETADMVQPVIYPPQVAIIGCGQVREHPWAQAGALSVRRAMTVVVGGDHRVSSGRSAAHFLRRLDDLLQNPERL